MNDNAPSACTAPASHPQVMRARDLIARSYALAGTRDEPARDALPPAGAALKLVSSAYQTGRRTAFAASGQVPGGGRW